MAPADPLGTATPRAVTLGPLRLRPSAGSAACFKGKRPGSSARATAGSITAEVSACSIMAARRWLRPSAASEGSSPTPGSGCGDPGCGLFSGQGSRPRQADQELRALQGNKGCGLCTLERRGRSVPRLGVEPVGRSRPPPRVVVTPQAPIVAPMASASGLRATPVAASARDISTATARRRGATSADRVRRQGLRPLRRARSSLFHHGTSRPATPAAEVRCGKGCGLCGRRLRQEVRQSAAVKVAASASDSED